MTAGAAPGVAVVLVSHADPLGPAETVAVTVEVAAPAALALVPAAAAAAPPSAGAWAWPLPLGATAMFVAHLHDRRGRAFAAAGPLAWESRPHRRDRLLLRPLPAVPTTIAAAPAPAPVAAWLVTGLAEGDAVWRVGVTDTPLDAYVRVHVTTAILPGTAVCRAKSCAWAPHSRLLLGLDHGRGGSSQRSGAHGRPRLLSHRAGGTCGPRGPGMVGGGGGGGARRSNHCRLCR